MATILEFAPAFLASGGSISTSKTCTAGSAVVVLQWSSEWSSPATPTCTVTGSTGAPIGTSRRAVDYPIFRAWLAENVSGGTVIAEVSGFHAAAKCQIAAFEIVGAPTSSAMDAWLGNVAVSDPTGDAAASPGIAVADGSVVIAAFTYDGPASAASWTQPSTYTAATSPTDSDQAMRLAHKVFTGAASGQVATATTSGSATWFESFLIAIKDGGGGGGSSTTPLKAQHFRRR